ncbi:MAG TPA: hypothetical protein ENH10_06785 [Bacteroidetes bacterium]|nr:septum formation initiator [bacterium BMS3Bbin04]HDO65723.1 hypothetical protein [Bacteroidota bacterium]HEX04848.1 hypothetical protein [Bacteroidota bacterium]
MMIPGTRTVIYTCLAGSFLALAAYTVFDKEAGVLQVREVVKQHHDLTVEARALEARRDYLTVKLELLELDDPQALETIAREKNLIHPGDTVYRIHYRQPADDESKH